MRWTLVCLLLSGMAQSATAADPDRGQQVFSQTCIACHSLEPNKSLTGPSLFGLWGRKAGSLQSFMRYSPALKAADVEWTDETLDRWITDPQAFIPGNHMGFDGIAEDELRADLIAFLKNASNSDPTAPVCSHSSRSKSFSTHRCFTPLPSPNGTDRAG